MSKKQQIIYQEQDKILTKFAQTSSFPFILSGGTALSRFYLHHRYSEDLDFFCEQTELSFPAVEAQINRLRKSGLLCELVGRTDQPGLLKIASYTVKLTKPIKVDFLEDPFSGMWRPVLKKNEMGVAFRVDALDLIYYRKFYALLEQTAKTGGTIVRIKDLVDLYYLHQTYQSIPDRLAYYRRHNIALPDEKLMLIFSKIKRGQLSANLPALSVTVTADELQAAFSDVVDELTERGLGRA